VKRILETLELFRCVSLFSGAGGFDLGFIKAGFEIIWANDNNEDACRTYMKNIGYHIRWGDINTYLNELAVLHRNEVDVMIGGSPCQGFSSSGSMDPNDPRSKLIWAFIKAVELVLPKVVVLENIKLLGTGETWGSVKREILSRLRTLGYSVGVIVLNSSEFNTPQLRERAFFIGFRLGDSSLIPDLAKMMEPYRIKAGPVKDVLLSLPRIKDITIRKFKVKKDLNPILPRSPYSQGLLDGRGCVMNLNLFAYTVCATLGNATAVVDLKELYNLYEEWERPWILDYYDYLKGGGLASLYEEVPSHIQRITVEQAAVIQTFPVGYEFMGKLLSSRFRQVGNAVPVNMAHQIALMVRDCLSSNNLRDKVIPIIK